MSRKHLKTAVLGAALLTSALAAPWAGATPAAADSTAADSQPIKSYKLAAGDGSAVMAVHGHVLVPLRDLAESLGWSVSWNKGGGIILQKDQETLSVKLQQKQILSHGKNLVLSEPVQAVKGQAFVSVREMAQALGAEAAWDANTKTVNILSRQDPSALEFKYTFAQTAEGWTAGFADLPADYKSMDFQLQNGPKSLPESGATSGGSFMLSGMNRSDDLFMYLSRRLDKSGGLKANTVYQVKLAFDLTVKSAGDSVGIGGSPLSSVYVKAGVLNQEPKAIETQENGGEGFLRMNVDKGNQSVDGKDMPLLGNLEPDPADTPESDGYFAKHFERTFTATSGPNGEIYVIIGTDSGYEGLTTLYYSNIALTVSEQK